MPNTNLEVETKQFHAFLYYFMVEVKLIRTMIHTVSFYLYQILVFKWYSEQLFTKFETSVSEFEFVINCRTTFNHGLCDEPTEEYRVRGGKSFEREARIWRRGAGEEFRVRWSPHRTSRF